MVFLVLAIFILFLLYYSIFFVNLYFFLFLFIFSIKGAETPSKSLKQYSYKHLKKLVKREERWKIFIFFIIFFVNLLDFYYFLLYNYNN
ncbi:hypothetical protein DMB91_07320 [Campylobacter sp. MIT 97-5078]|nr:hypothetical protein LR59_04930 [Campylobacter sp. MIT 97-5078]TQR25605.1 hypothetical protein DMB91_07320 [Campylobacter sp. MIT 97-5078]